MVIDSNFLNNFSKSNSTIYFKSDIPWLNGVYSRNAVSFTLEINQCNSP